MGRLPIFKLIFMEQTHRIAEVRPQVSKQPRREARRARIPRPRGVGMLCTRLQLPGCGVLAWVPCGVSACHPFAIKRPEPQTNPLP